MNKYRLIGKKIREARLAMGMEQTVLAEKLGYSPTAVNLYEKGKRKISIEDLEKVSNILARPIGYFLTEEPYDEKSFLEHEKNRLLREAKRLLEQIEQKGAPDSPSQALSIRSVPLIGAVPAEDLEKALAASTDLMPVPPGIDVDFAFRITGNCMKPIYFEKDIVLVRKTENAENGQRILASVNGNLLVRIYYRYNLDIILRAANPRCNDIIVNDSGLIGIIMGAYTIR
ncbi:MAG: XRE family transcriptional regulator [bacterium]|nr:XRE family transcriptional regulator [bacterium]MDD4153683.1 XRE family transcriptional regulator [bacterium]MDD4558975.1 XRE family transcriptional regulator [bacterium]